MNACDLCHEDTRNTKRDERGDLLCTECREHAAYYASLTPEELRADHEMIARHCEESERV